MPDLQHQEEQPGLIRHIERFLGRMRGGWTHDDTGRRLPVSVAQFSGQPRRGATTLVTLGLSNHVLQQPDGGIRQELVFSCWERSGLRNAPGMLTHLGDYAIRRHTAFLRGEWEVYQSPLLDGTNLFGFFLGIPKGFPREFLFNTELYEEPLVFVQLFPITAAEAQLRDLKGEEALMEKLVNADLLDLGRRSAV